jgi:hypothetical protein
MPTLYFNSFFFPCTHESRPMMQKHVHQTNTMKGRVSRLCAARYILARRHVHVGVTHTTVGLLLSSRLFSFIRVRLHRYVSLWWRKKEKEKLPTDKSDFR